MNRRRWARGLVGAAGVALLASCAGSPPHPPPPPVPTDQVISAASLLEGFHGRGQSIQGLRAGLDLVWTSRPGAEGDRCGGSLSWESAERFRLRGTAAAFFTVFDLVAAGRYVWLDVPREQLLVHGQRQDPGWRLLPFPPQLFAVAVLADPCPQGVEADVLLRRSAEALTLVAPDWTLDIDPVTHLPRRYRSAGAEIRWQEWAVRGGTPWPHSVEIHPLEGGGSLQVRLGRLQTGQEFPASRFQLEVDDEREILTPLEAARRWRGFEMPKS